MAGIQLQGVLDELCFYDGPLGATVTKEDVQLTVWAPTAQQVIFPPAPSAAHLTDFSQSSEYHHTKLHCSCFCSFSCSEGACCNGSFRCCHCTALLHWCKVLAVLQRCLTVPALHCVRWSCCYGMVQEGGRHKCCPCHQARQVPGQFRCVLSFFLSSDLHLVNLSMHIISL